MGDFPVEVLLKIKKEIDSTVSVIPDLDNIAAKHKIRRNLLSAYWKHIFKIEIKGYCSLAKLNQLRKMVLSYDVLPANRILAIQLGYADEGGLHNLVIRQLNISLKKYIEHIRNDCEKYPECSCESFYESYCEQSIKHIIKVAE